MKTKYNLKIKYGKLDQNVVEVWLTQYEDGDICLMTENNGVRQCVVTLHAGGGATKHINNHFKWSK